MLKHFLLLLIILLKLALYFLSLRFLGVFSICWWL